MDQAVLEAYGWDELLSIEYDPEGVDEKAKRSFIGRVGESLQRLVALNVERAAEEAKGNVRWLWPEYQNTTAIGAAASGKPSTAKQTKLEVEDNTAATPSKAETHREWPTDLPAQAAALRSVLQEVVALSTLEEIAAHFGKPNKKRLAEVERLLQTMVAMGAVRAWKGKWVGV